MSFLVRTFTRVFWICLAILAVLLTLGAMSGLLADRIWLCELATHFQLQYVVLLSTIALLFALDGRFRWGVYTLAIAIAAFCYHLLPLYVGGPAETDEPRSLRILSANIAFFNPTHDKLIALVADEKPDLVMLYEVSPDWVETLEGLSATFPHSKIEPHEGHAGIAVFSRLPLDNLQVETIGLDPLPIIMASVKVNEIDVSLCGAHPMPPVSWHGTLDRNEQLVDLAEKIVMLPTPLIVVGDLNTSGWNPAFKRLVYDTGLRDSRQGFGVQATWATMLPLLRTPIDHCLVSARVKVLDRRVGPDIGSDHYPIIVDLLIK